MYCYRIHIRNNVPRTRFVKKAPLVSVANPGLHSLLCMTIPPPKGPAAGRSPAHSEEAVMPNRLTVRQAGSARMPTRRLALLRFAAVAFIQHTTNESARFVPKPTGVLELLPSLSITRWHASAGMRTSNRPCLRCRRRFPGHRDRAPAGRSASRPRAASHLRLSDANRPSTRHPPVPP